MQTLIREACRRCFVIAALFACLSSAANDGLAQTTSAGANTGNELSLTAQAGPHANKIYTSMTVCMPGSITNCQVIDRVMVDTGTSGLVIRASALGPSISLPQQTVDGNVRLADCIPFSGAGFVMAWGPVKLADVQLAGERAASVPVLMVDDPQFPDIPANCLGKNARLDMVGGFGANAVLGIGPTLRDCGKACEDKPIWYYRCSESECQPTTVASDKQLANPVTFFAHDNNGVVISLPSVPLGGSLVLIGLLTFGIDTQSNNRLGSATVLPVDQEGLFTTVYKGKAYRRSFIDSGAIAIHFLDQDLPRCATYPLYYCPPAALSLSATIHGTNGTAKAVNFRVDNAEAVLAEHPNYAIYDGIAGVPPSSDPELFTWGLPFFLGKIVYVAIEGKNTPAGLGPYFAFYAF
jgi:hypothetical protein